MAVRQRSNKGAVAKAAKKVAASRDPMVKGIRASVKHPEIILAAEQTIAQLIRQNGANPPAQFSRIVELITRVNDPTLGPQDQEAAISEAWREFLAYGIQCVSLEREKHRIYDEEIGRANAKARTTDSTAQPTETDLRREKSFNELTAIEKKSHAQALRIMVTEESALLKRDPNNPITEQAIRQSLGRRGIVPTTKSRLGRNKRD